MSDARAREGRSAEWPGSRGRIYLIEDDPVTRARVAELLSQSGYEVVTVPTLEAAITEGFWNGDPAKLLFVGRRGRGGVNVTWPPLPAV